MSREDEHARREEDFRIDAPYVENPDEMVMQDGLMCWRDADRVCGADCVAFNQDQLDEHGHPIPGPDACALITVQTGRNEKLHFIMQLLQKSNTKMPYEMPEVPKL